MSSGDSGVSTIARGAEGQQKFLMGYSSFSANQTPIWVAKEEGLFKRFGTDPDLILIEGGTRGAQALISGDLPIMGMSGQPVISARARGSDLTMIAGTVNKMNYVLIAARISERERDHHLAAHRGIGRFELHHFDHLLILYELDEVGRKAYGFQFFGPSRPSVAVVEC